MAYTHEIRSTQGTGPLEYAFVLVLVAALAAVVVFLIGYLTSSPFQQTGSCLTRSTCSAGTSATDAGHHGG
ncbi:MAG: hypothetical protein U0S36_01040 [Candidatus Nanopelagicales bacterium]